MQSDLAYPRVMIMPRNSMTNPHQMGKDFYTENVGRRPAIRILHRYNNIFIPQLNPNVYPTIPLSTARL
jgi:hypothetical protein